MKYTIEELIALAQSDGDLGKISEVEQFIVELGLKPEKVKVPADHIYYHYVWWKEDKKDYEFLSRKAFFNEFRRHFHRVIDSGNRYYNVNKDSFKWDIETKIRMRKLRRQEKEWFAEKRRWKARFKPKGKKPNIRD